jgi:hypothetical protein
MDEDALSFTKVKINSDLLDEIWSFDPRTLDNVQGHLLSTYAVALSQYLIYFTYQKNKSRAEIHRLTKFIDRTVSLSLSSDPKLLKAHKTKAAAHDYIITDSPELMEAEAKLDNLKIEMIQVDGMEKNISELIATIKRELTRRENELYATRQERR